MPRNQLKNKPLVEAILELRWALESRTPPLESDPHYKLLLGRLFDRLLARYPEHEPLPTAGFPDDFLGHVVQHRFRAGPNQWPLIQLGPGLLTVNSTADYMWDDFRPRAIEAVQRLYEAHPKVSDLKITNLTLRYINAVEFDYSNQNIYGFLREKLKVSIDLPKNLFENTGVENRPHTFVWQSTFNCSSPRGQVTIRFATGQKESKSAMIWETTVQSFETDVPTMPSGFESWIDPAHAVTDDWFFRLIEGELERKFSGD